jgi:ATP-binding cassette subfamily B (MDR/TAP) protein 1
MNWQFMILGAHLTKKYRKKIFEKYLKFHLSFFDLEINSPGALLTRLSIDTTQLNSLIIAILVDQ